MSVEVVIPAFNAARYIAAALQSVVNQTLPPVGIIVVDDGSSDGTSAIVREFAAANPAVPIECVVQANAGPSAARNRGLGLVRAEFVALLDADDMWVATKLQKQRECFSRSDLMNVGMVYCDYGVMDEAGNTTADPRRQTALIRGSIARQLVSGNRITGSASSVLIRNAVLREVGAFDESLVCAEDWDLWLRIAERFAIDFVDEKLVMVRKHGDNAKRNEKRMLGGELGFAGKLHASGRLGIVHWLRLLARMRREGVSLADYPELKLSTGSRVIFCAAAVGVIGYGADCLWRIKAAKG